MLPLPDSPWKVHLPNVGPEATGVTVHGLTPARTYQFRVCAVNQVGKGQYSTETSRCVHGAPWRGGRRWRGAGGRLVSAGGSRPRPSVTDSAQTRQGGRPQGDSAGVPGCPGGSSVGLRGALATLACVVPDSTATCGAFQA